MPSFDVNFRLQEQIREAEIEIGRLRQDKAKLEKELASIINFQAAHFSGLDARERQNLTRLRQENEQLNAELAFYRRMIKGTPPEMIPEDGPPPPPEHVKVLRPDWKAKAAQLRTKIGNGDHRPRILCGACGRMRPAEANSCVYCAFEERGDNDDNEVNF